MNTSIFRSIPVLALAIFSPLSPASAQLIRSAAGTTAADVTGARDSFRLDLGGGTVAGANGSFGGIRREINWDGVPDALSAPNNLPADFFNVNSPRGAIFATPGTGFQVSANTGNPSGATPQFGNIDVTYPSLFEPFSVQRLFTALGSNIVDVNFFVPGTTTPALTKGFGSIFSDVDLASTTSLQFFDGSNNSLGTFFVPPAQGNETFSFLGVSFISPVISKVRITNGNQALAPGNVTGDVVVMDDFIYAEPSSAVPDAAGTLLLLGLALPGLLLVQRLTVRLEVGPTA
jgi:hypothetical protein